MNTPENTSCDYIIVGKIGSTYGIHGWLKIQSFTGNIADVLDYEPWYIEDHSGWKLIKREAGKLHGKGVIAKLDGYNNPEKARLLTGKSIAVKRTQLPALKDNEFYWRDLEGLTVINQHNEELGVISYMIETGANDVLVIQKNNKEHAIPYLPDDVVISIDLEKRIMRVNWDLI